MIHGAWYVGQSDGVRFATSLRTKWTDAVWTDVRPGDFDGDGKDDLVARLGGSWWITRTGDGVGGRGGRTSLWASWSDLTWVDLRVGVFDGDGIDDIAGRLLGSWWIARSSGDAVVTTRRASWANVEWKAVAASDVDEPAPSPAAAPLNADEASSALIADEDEDVRRQAVGNVSRVCDGRSMPDRWNVRRQTSEINSSLPSAGNRLSIPVDTIPARAVAASGPLAMDAMTMRPSYRIRPFRRSCKSVFPAAEMLESRVLLAAPIAQDDAVATDENTVLVGNLLADNGSGADSDPESDPLTVSAVNGNAAAVGTAIVLASGAALTVNADGTFTYDPSGAFADLTLGESELDTFTYRISDGTFMSGTATVTVTVSGVNTDPVVNGDAFQIGKFTVLNGDLLADDDDADGHTLTITHVNGSAAAVGTTVTLASGSTLRVLSGGSFTYTPGGPLKRLELGESEIDSFTYSVSDGSGGTGTATVTVRVSGEGLDDLVGYYQGTWQIGRSTGSAFATSVTAAANLAWDALTYGDFNADGLTDVVGLIDGSWRVGLSNGSGFTFSTWATWANLAWSNVSVGDVNADGRDDIMARINGNWWLALSNGTTFDTASRWAAWSNQTWQHASLTDLNNDGRADLLAYITGGWYAALSNGTDAFGAAKRWAKWADLPWDGIGTFDFNNDGRSDIYGMYAGEWYVGQAAVSATRFDTVLRATWSPLVVWKDIRTGDFNGDGKDDLTARANGTWWISYTGNKAGGVGGATAQWARWSDLDWLDVTVGDFDGDGRDDLAGRFAGEWWVSRTGSPTVTTSRWATWNDVPWQAVTAADFDGSVPQTQFSLASSAALWSQLSDDAEFAALLLAG